MKTIFFEIERWEEEKLDGLCRNLGYETVKQPLTAEWILETTVENIHGYMDGTLRHIVNNPATAEAG